MEQQIPKKLIDCFEESVQNSVNDACREFADRVCRTYNLNKMDVMALIPDVRTGSGGTKCRGVKKDGACCTREGSYEGYCKLHLYQKKATAPTPVPRVHSNLHTHDPSVGFVCGCPECDKMMDSGFKDLDDMLG